MVESREPLFLPFRALGYITDKVPFAVQRLGRETYVTVSVGKAWQVGTGAPPRCPDCRLLLQCSCRSFLLISWQAVTSVRPRTRDCINFEGVNFREDFLAHAARAGVQLRTAAAHPCRAPGEQTTVLCWD